MNRGRSPRSVLVPVLVVLGCAVAAGCGGSGGSGASGRPAAAAPTTAATAPTGTRPKTASPVPTPRSAATAPATGPSGASMPVGDLPGWHQVFADGFDGAALGPTWARYSGRPGGDPAGWWEPGNAVVGGGALHLRTSKVGGRWASAGVGSWHGLDLRYGRVDVRFRAPEARGVAYAFLLWPQDGGWPPEVDFAEDGGGDRKSTSATLHYGADNRQIARSVDADFTTWHTIGVQWSPGTLVYTLDGARWGSVVSTSVPTTSMVLALQTQVWGCHIAGYRCPGASTPASSSVDVDWVVAYARRSS